MSAGVAKHGLAESVLTFNDLSLEGVNLSLIVVELHLQHLPDGDDCDEPFLIDDADQWRRNGGIRHVHE